MDILALSAIISISVLAVIIVFSLISARAVRADSDRRTDEFQAMTFEQHQKAAAKNLRLSAGSNDVHAAQYYHTQALIHLAAADLSHVDNEAESK